ncbi:MAG: FKBP-type peptidyl-prolyl cis-trans isomerase [Prevotella sp.]|nr:FKBP-type peptidyl-prolyl cis-trans isomerase [Prevotella sp.]
MKRIFLIALTVMVSASFYTASAQKVTLVTPSDSLSYAAGATMTDGLLPFLKQQYGVDETFIDDFVRGFEEALKSGVDDPMKAYSAGIQIAAMVKDRMLPSISNDLDGSAYSLQNDLFQKGFVAALKKDSTIFNEEQAKKLFTSYMEAVNMAKHETTIKAGEKFLKENSQKKGVKVTPSGLQYKILEKGKGPIPTKDDQVIVKYEGRLIDGTVFDSSYKREDQTNKFRPTDVIKGWTEALTMMPVGSKWELYIPQELAYGARQTGDIPAYSTLIFIVELVGIDK